MKRIIAWCASHPDEIRSLSISSSTEITSRCKPLELNCGTAEAFQYDGKICSGGPDHYARLAATKHFRDFLMASRPAPKQPEPKDKMLTLPELEAMLRANKDEQNQA